MNFEDNYNNIKIIIKDDLNLLETNIQQIFSDKTPLDSQLLSFLTAPSKRLRPVLGFLFLRGSNKELNVKQRDILLAIELIHNATLIHDDVIDNSSKRRNQETLNSKFDSNLAVVAGDFLLSISMEKVIETGSVDVLKLFTSTLKSACLGEINQYFNKFNLTSIEDYIEKSKDKTAVLFRTGILGGLMLADYKVDDKLKHAAIEFSENFGIAFQIRDDLLNIVNSDTLKPCFNDLSEGIYTAPVIYAYKDEKIVEGDDVLAKIKSSSAIEKTKALMDNYFDNSISALECLDESPYKLAILELIALLREQN